MTETSNNTIVVPPKSEVATAVAEPTATPQRQSSKNALTHGIYAKDFVLSWEDENELWRLREGTWAELQPEGCIEEETAFAIVRLLWQKRRLARSLELTLKSESLSTKAAEAKCWDDIVNILTAASTTKTSLAEEANNSLKALTKAIEKVSEINAACISGHSEKEGPAKEAFLAAHKASLETGMVSHLLRKQVVPRMLDLEKAQEAETDSAIEKIYAPELMEKMVQIELKFDARIDKLMTRLATLKEYKRFRQEAQRKTLELTET